MSWQWTYIERTLNMQWTRHRTLRKLRERANRWKSKENSIFVLFSENNNQLHRFAAICSFLDCVQCVFNVAFTVCSLYVKKNLQETIHLCNPVRPNLSHALQTHNVPWHFGLTWPIPFILIPLRRCVKHGRVQWVGVLDVNVACGPKTKRNAFPRRTLSKVLSLQKLQRQSCKGGKQNTACYASHAFLHRPHTFYERYHALAMSWQWTYIERTLNMQWTRHRTLRKLRERANRWKSKENSIFVLFSENNNQLHRFAAICSFLDCVQCVFNVAFTVCSLYVKKNLQETIHLCNPVRPNLSHALQTHNVPWHFGLTWPIPFILIPLRRCVKHGRVQWVGVLDVNVACGPKTKRNAFPRRTLSKVLSLQKLQRQSCKGGIQNTACYASHAFLHRPHTFYERYHALAMSWQWTYIERTLNMQWTRHRTLRKLRERANRWKSKENSIFVLFSENNNQLHRFAAICSFLDCVQCVFNVAFTVCSLYVKKNLQETIHLCNPVRPNLSHALQTHNVPWHFGLTWPIPFILIPLRRCVKHGRVQWVGVLDVNVACGPKTKRNAFPRSTLSKVLSLQKLQRQSCKGGIQNTACYASHAFLHRPHTFYERYHALAMSWQWTYIERTLNMQWTRHRTLRKLRERANRWKSKENSIFVLFSENNNQLHRFAAICSFLDCVQCVFNVAFTVCSLYVKKNLQETIHLCNPVRPNLSHALQTHNVPWHFGLTWPIPFILIPLRRCVKHGRVQWVGVLDVNVACGPKTKRNAFPRRTLSKVLSLQKLQRQSCKGGIQNTACYASHAFLHRPHTFYERYHALAMRWQWTYIERTLNMQWTRHRTLRKLRERANRWKSKENSIFVLFFLITINCTDLLPFAAFWTVFNVCSMLRSLYVHCMLKKTYKRPYTCVTLSDPTYPMLSRHTTYLDTSDWPGLFPSYLSLCAGAWSMVACSEWVCWMWMWPAGRKQKEMLFRDVPWAKCSLCKSCKDKAAKAEFKIQPVTLPTPSFTDLILFTKGAMRSQWADSERTLNVHWTCSERGIEHWGNWGKERNGGNRKKIQYLCFFLKITINCTDLLLFAAFWTVFNVCSMLRSLYVHCMLKKTYKRPYTCVTLSDPTYPMLSRHTTYLDTSDWPGLFPSYLSLCAGAWSMVACSEWVCWMWMWPAGRKQKEMLFRDGTLSKVLSLQKLQRQSCKGGIQNTACYASHAFLHRPHTFYERYHALAMSWQWTYIERTLNMQWTRHRTLRKLRERANRWKSKENSIFVLFSENNNQLHRFAAICSFLDCVQCVFNVAFTVCSLYVKKNLQETIHLCNPVRPNLSHALQTHNVPWHFGLTWPIPFILIPLRRCVKHGRVQWVGVLDVNVACGPKTKRNAFPRRYPEQSALSAKVAKTKLQRRNSKYSLLRFPRLPSQTSYFLRKVPCARNELTVNVHWTYIEHAVNEA